MSTSAAAKADQRQGGMFYLLFDSGMSGRQSSIHSLGADEVQLRRRAILQG